MHITVLKYFAVKIYSDDDIFDENAASQRRRSSLFITKYFMRRESVWKLKTRRKSQLTVKIHGTHLSHASTSKADDRTNPFPQTTLVKNGDTNARCGGGGYKNCSSMLPEVAGWFSKHEIHISLWYPSTAWNDYGLRVAALRTFGIAETKLPWKYFCRSIIYCYHIVLDLCYRISKL